MPIAFVGKSTIATGSTTLNPTRTAAAGNFLVLIMQYYALPAGGAATAPTENGGWLTALAPTPVGEVVPGQADGIGIGIFYLENLAGGTYLPVVGIPNGNFCKGLIAEFSGVATSSSKDQVANSQSVSTTQSRVSGTTAALAGTGELAIACVGGGNDPGLSNVAITDPPSGFTSLAVDNNSSASMMLESCYQILASASAASTSWSWTDASTKASAGGIATFKAAGGGGGGGGNTLLGVDNTSGGFSDMSGGMYCKSGRVLAPATPRIFIPGMTRRTPRHPTLSLR